jgi:hypothetical protein
VTPVILATGAAGADGKTVRNGTTVPSSGLGVDGDFYIRTTTSEIYGPKTAGAWGSPVSLVGPQGPQGTAGAAGAAGATGPTGPTGATGPTGPAGSPLPRVASTTSSATPTPNADTTDMYILTAQAAAAAFAAPTGSPVQGQQLMIRIKDDGTARALTWNAIFRVIGVTLPATTVISKTLYIGAKYNSTDTKWDVLAVGQEV